MEDNNTNNTIVNNMLSHLDGWILDIQTNANVSSTKYNKKIKADELLYFYNVATDYALSYTQLDDVISLNIGCLLLFMGGLAASLSACYSYLLFCLSSSSIWASISASSASSPPQIETMPEFSLAANSLRAA